MNATVLLGALSPGMALVAKLAILSFVAVSIALVYWTHADARRRSSWYTSGTNSSLACASPRPHARSKWVTVPAGAVLIERDFDTRRS